MPGLSQEFKLRDVFGPKNVGVLAQSIKRVWPAFDSAGFAGAATAGFQDLNFGARSLAIQEALHAFLPPDFEKACLILIEALGPELRDEGTTDWDAFIIMPQCGFVSEYGRDHFDLSMRALYEMTKRFSAEGHLRTFLEVDYEKTMRLLHEWTQDPSPHVRRLVSEGTRPRLPLAARIPRFVREPRPVIALLLKLRDDPSLYVRRSVANNLNDIAKDHPDLVVETLKSWRAQPGPELEWIVRHATRSLVKSGHKGALALLGTDQKPKVKVAPLRLQKKRVQYGDMLVFETAIHSTSRSRQKLTVDFVVGYLKKDGSHAAKVFKLRAATLPAGETLRVGRRLRMRDTSGRKLNAGLHTVRLQINGRLFPETSFRLMRP